MDSANQMVNNKLSSLVPWTSSSVSQQNGHQAEVRVEYGKQVYHIIEPSKQALSSSVQRNISEIPNVTFPFHVVFTSSF